MAIFMEGRTCWICGRDGSRVRNDASGIMWEKEVDPLIDLVFMGEVVEVDKRREIDTWEDGTYVRRQLPPGTVSYYDIERDAMVMMRKESLSVCRICAELVVSMPPQKMDHRISRLRAMGTRDLFTDNAIWQRHDAKVAELFEKKKQEVIKMEGQFPQNDFRVLLALTRVKPTDGVTLTLLGSMTGLLPIQCLFGLRNLIAKRPELGRLFEDTQVFFLNTQVDSRAVLNAMIQDYLANPDNRIIKERVERGGTIA
jgi:hypothetical protein